MRWDDRLSMISCFQLHFGGSVYLVFFIEFMAFMMSARGDTTLSCGRLSQIASTVYLLVSHSTALLTLILLFSLNLCFFISRDMS